MLHFGDFQEESQRRDWRFAGGKGREVFYGKKQGRAGLLIKRVNNAMPGQNIFHCIRVS
jgi:hypothetical protein